MRTLAGTWRKHVEATSFKAFRTLGFLRRNFRDCNKSVREQTYTTMVRPTLEYAPAAWDPYTSDQINQRRAARFVSNNCRDKTPGCVTAMVKSLGWEPLKECRKSHRLIMMYMYKVMHGLVCIPESSYMVQTSDSRTRGANRLIQHHTNIAAYKQSFFPRTIQE